MSFGSVSEDTKGRLTREPSTHLLESFVVDEAGCIFGNVKLTLLNVFAELPVERRSVSSLWLQVQGSEPPAATLTE